MNLQLELAQLPLIINVALRVITAMFFARYLLPLFIKEAKVKNGLKKLRLELLISGTIIFLINTVGLIIIVFNYFGLSTRVVLEAVTYFNSLGFLVYAIIKFKIYTQRYTPESKKLHEKFEKMEKKELEKAEAKKKS